MSPQEYPELDQDQGSSRGRRTLRADRRNVQAIVIAAVPIVVLLVVIALGVILVRGRSRGASAEATPTLLPTNSIPTALVAAVSTTVATDTPAPVAETPTPTPEPTQAQVEVATDTPVPAEPTVTPTPSDELVAGAVARVTNTGGQVLRMRGAAGLNAPILKGLSEGTELEILGGPTSMDGYEWFNVRDDTDTEGWVAGDWLVRVR
jgi:hypothetical protein